MFFPESGIKEKTHATAARKVKQGFKQSSTKPVPIRQEAVPDISRVFFIQFHVSCDDTSKMTKKEQNGQKETTHSGWLHRKVSPSHTTSPFFGYCLGTCRGSKAHVQAFVKPRLSAPLKKICLFFDLIKVSVDERSLLRASTECVAKRSERRGGKKKQENLAKMKPCFRSQDLRNTRRKKRAASIEKLALRIGPLKKNKIRTTL